MKEGDRTAWNAPPANILCTSPAQKAMKSAGKKDEVGLKGRLHLFELLIQNATGWVACKQQKCSPLSWRLKSKIRVPSWLGASEDLFQSTDSLCPQSRAQGVLWGLIEEH